MKLRHISIILLINITLFAIVFGIAHLWADNRLPKTRAQFLTPEQVQFYKKYSAEMNHLRVFDFLNLMPRDVDKSTTDFLFSKIDTGKRVVLIQGDSWAEQMVTSHPSYIALKIFSEENNTQFILGGTNSFATSIMQAQYRLLRQDFSIFPEIVVAIIDQTDIGDELCRYRHQVDQNALGEHIVKPYDGTELVPYVLKPYFDLIDILDKPGNPLLKLIEYRLVKAKSMVPRGCYFNQVMGPLTGNLTESDRRYVVDRIGAYIAEVFRAPSEVKKLVIVTHFHAPHQTGEYVVTVADLVKDAVEASASKSLIKQLDFIPADYVDQDKSKVFKPNDPFSHLTDDMHRKIYTRKILREIAVPNSP
jgi:hypothetical protein